MPIKKISRFSLNHLAVGIGLEDNAHYHKSFYKILKYGNIAKVLRKHQYIFIFFLCWGK